MNLSCDENSVTLESECLDYSSDYVPLIKNLIPSIPLHTFTPTLLDKDSSGVLPLDLSKELESYFPATTPALLANYVRIVKGSFTTCAMATSQVFYVFEGAGHTNVLGKRISWGAGDCLVLPTHEEAVHYCEGKATLYWVHDGPLLSYLGVTANHERFSPAIYKHSRIEAQLRNITNNTNNSLANKPRSTIAITNTIWTMFGLLPNGTTQYPQAHESATLDFIVDCKPGCFTMIGTQLGPDGMIANGKRHDWIPGVTFVIPSGYWCSRHNQSDSDAYSCSIQDAGLHIYLRTLETAYSNPKRN